MARQTMERLRSEALDLPNAERAELASDLVRSLDGPADSGASRDWELEIVRRLDEIDAGTARIIDREEFSRRMRERLGSD